MDSKTEVKKKADYACQKCGYSSSNRSGVEAHHIVPNSKGGPDTVENLACLCKRCHLFAPDYETVVVDDQLYPDAFEIYLGTFLPPLLDIAEFGNMLHDRYGCSPMELSVSGMLSKGEPVPHMSESNMWGLMAGLVDYRGFRDCMPEAFPATYFIELMDKEAEV